ncbi:MAG: DUF3341 domain-containing protein [Cytophagales bacterium]
METKKNYLVGIFDDSDKVLHGIGHVREQGVKIEEVFTPYPVHGIEAKLGYKRSKLSVAAFMFGALGTFLAILMQVWMLGIDWPMIIGGKNFVSAPTFVPVTFELTVLIGSLGMVGTFFVLSDLKPHKTPRIFDLRSTDDKMVMAVDLAVNKLSENEIQSILQASGASEVYRKDFE